MRKLCLLVTLMVASSFFLAAAPSPASAANCTNTAMTPPTYSPHAGYNVYFKVQVAGCTSDVEKVSFAQCPAAGGGVAAGFNDTSTGQTVACQQQTVYLPPLYNCLPDVCNPPGSFTQPYTYTAWCWYAGAVHFIRPFWQYRIKGFSQAWGPWHFVYGAFVNFAC